MNADEFDLEKHLREERELAEWIGPALAKACFDQPFQYLVVLRNGQRIAFAGAEYAIGSQWITLLPFDGKFEELPACIGPHCCERGIDVKIADIMFAVAAPHGT
jgi:hypothetical protein